MILTMDRGFATHHSGLLLPERLARRPTCIDLFCGCGGFSLGFMMAGWEVLAAVDWDVDCMITYLLNLGSYPCQVWFVEESDRERAEKALSKQLRRDEQSGFATFSTAGSGWISGHPEAAPVRNFILGDVRKLSGRDILDIVGKERGEIDCVIGSPPCQGFSRLGKRNVADPRNNLTFEFARLVLEIMPKAICMENVPGILDMVTPDGFPVIDEFCRILEDGGFGTISMLKKALMETSGAGVALRGSGKSETKANTQQLSMEVG